MEGFLQTPIFLIFLLKKEISDHYTMTGIFFEDDILDDFLEEWLEASNIKDNTAINKTITQTMYDSWKKQIWRTAK